MLTSNKILSGTLIAVFGGLSLIHLGLYAKYNGGNFISGEQEHLTHYEQHVLDPVKEVVLHGLQNIHIYPAQKNRLDIDRMASRDIHYKVLGDTLYIEADTSGGLSGNNNRYRVNAVEDTPAELFLSTPLTIHAIAADIQLAGTAGAGNNSAYTITLQNSTLAIGDPSWTVSEKKKIHALNILAEHSSEVRFQCDIDSLRIQLRKSLFLGNGGNIGVLNLETDSLSTITLAGSNLRNAIILKK